MVSIRISIAIAACVTLAGSTAELRAQSAPDNAQQTVEQALRAASVQLRAAAEKLDANALYAYVLDTATPPIIEAGRVAPTRAAALAGTVAGFQGLTSISYHYTREHVTVLSPTAALWVGEGTATALLRDGREIEAPFAETLVWVMRDGQWKILHAHRSVPQR